jgi:hypothetical protein
MGGGAILDNCIVRIRGKYGDLWRHPNYHHGVVTILEVYGAERWVVEIDSKVQAMFSTEKQAQRWAKKMGLEVKS